MQTTVLGSAKDRSLRSCVATARLCAIVTLTVAIIMLLDHILQLQDAVTTKNNLQGMSLVTACTIALVSLTQIALSLGRRALTACGAWITTSIGVGLLLNYSICGSDTLSSFIDNLLGSSQQVTATVSMATAICIGLLGTSILIQSRAAVADLLSLCVTLITSFSLLGYAYDVSELHTSPLFQTMALPTAATLWLLSLISIFVRPQSNWCNVVGAKTERGAAMRRQLLLMMFPVVVGWVLLRATKFQAIGPAAAMAVLVIVTIAALGVLILRDGRRLVQLDQERQSKLDLHKSMYEEMNTRLKSQAEEIWTRGAQQALDESSILKAQRLEALSRLTGGIAHDFNNLLQAISGGVELIAKRAAEGKSFNSVLDGVRISTQRGAKLGSHLLAFSHKQKLNVQPLSLNELIRNAQPMLATALGSSIVIRYDLATGGHTIMTDDAQFQLALLNLALNAKDAMRGRGELTLATSLVLTTLNSEDKEAQYVCVRVSDSGGGMSPDILARATEPFFSTKPEGSASGLGLAQVQGLMRQCRGDLTLSSHETVGTTVALLFPTVDDLVDSNITAQNRVLPSSLQSRQLIVVIEDDDAVRRVIVEGLIESGYDVAAAADGETGIALLKAVRPDAAVIDFLMPTLNGADVAASARKDRPDLPIVFMSGHFETAALEGFSRAAILRKPFNLNLLLEILAKLTAHKLTDS